MVGFSRAVNNYLPLDHKLMTSSEGRFIFELAQCIDSSDDQRYEAAKNHFINVNHPLPWQKAVINEGLEKMRGGTDDFA